MAEPATGRPATGTPWTGTPATETSARDASARGVWRDPSVFGIALAEVLSSVGTEMTWLALPWFVLATTHSATRMGVVFAAEVAPTALLGIPAGSVVDRFGARRTMLACDLIRAPLLAAFPVLHGGGLLSFPLLLGIVALVGVFTTPYLACQRLILPEIVGEHEEARIAQANTVVEGARNGAGLIGPAIAGVLISTIGAMNVLWIDAASYVLSFVVVLLVVRTSTRVRDGGSAAGMFSGLAYAMSDPILRSVAAVVVLSGFWGPLLLATLPVLAFERYGADPRIAGLLFTAFSGGLLAGGVLSYRALSRVEPLRLARFAIVWIAAWVAVLILRLPAPGVAGVLAAEALLIPSANAPVFTLLTTRVEPSMRGRVMTSILAANTIAGPLGYAVVGPSVRVLGLGGTFGIVAACAAATAVLFVRATRGVSIEPP